MPIIYKILPKLSLALVKLSLKLRVRNFTTIDQIQREVATYLYRLMKSSSKGFTFHGLENLDRTKPALFISNHRDIVLDAALVNLALYQCGYSTVEAAVGDNLLDQPWVSDLMRLNKSFVVKRNEKTKRGMLAASKNLSAYIHHSLTESNQEIWIAQKEGRAKDGVDKTNSALISMLLLNKNKEQSIEEYLQQLNIVPIAISYEYDPCDRDKAIELAEKELTGAYQKSENEDLRSITQGLVGEKGQIHIEFCQPIQGNYADSKAVAAAIDKQIIAKYKLYDTNLAAHAKLNNQDVEPAAEALLSARLHGLNDIQRKWLLTMYANPVYAKEALNN